MGKTFIRRLAAIVLLSILPAALVLAVVAARGALSFGWLALALGLGLAGGALMCALTVRLLLERAEVLDQGARDLEAKRPPIRLLHSERLMGGAENRLLAAGEQLVREVLALAEQRNELSAILRGMSEGVVVTDGQGQVLLTNGAARELFGLAPEADYRGRGLVEICREPALQQLLQRSIAQPGAVVANAEVALPGGGIRHLRVTAGVVGENASGRAARVLLLYDITQLKAYENLRSDFIANLTHEIRTPLSAICGYAETLLLGVDNADARQRFLAIIERQAHRLARLVDDLVSLSDLERGLTPLTREDLQPRRLLEEVVELIQEQAERQGVRLVIECPPELPALKGDHDRLHQVLINLLDNAVKYSSAGGVVTLAARMAPGGEAIELVVADRGEGIPAQYIPRLTERFYRVDQARSRELGGTGLGLAIVKHIVQLHHGELLIESRVREGTTVTVRIPLEIAAGTQVANGTPRAAL